jgi:hypothetical protein
MVTMTMSRQLTTDVEEDVVLGVTIGVLAF